MNVVMNNVSVARQAEITAYRDSCTIEWAGRIPHDAWEKFKHWFVKTNADVLRFDKAEQDYAIISQGPKEAIADYHVRFSRARNRAAANGVAHDTDNASKLRLLYLPQADVKSASRRVASRNSIEVMDPSAATR